MTEFGPTHFLNRELSWLEFNYRVLEEAMDKTNPLLERVKFFTIFSSNLDEFFEIRVAGLKQQIESEVVERTIDGRTSSETFLAIARKTQRLVDKQYSSWRNDLLPELEKNGFKFLDIEQLGKSDYKWITKYFSSKVRPVLTPLAIDPAHPFPQLLNKSLNLMVDLSVELDGAVQRRLAVVQLPRVLPRLIRLPGYGKPFKFVFMGNLIKHHLDSLFHGAHIHGKWLFRVTLNSDLYIDEEEVANLLKAVENELHNRHRGDAVRLEVESACPRRIRLKLLEQLNLTNDDLYVINGPLNPVRLKTLIEGDHSPELRDPPFVAPYPAEIRDAYDVFSAIRKHDILLHHPYDSFDAVVDFLEQSASDPDVLAVKLTLYRTGGDPRILGALKQAALNGKQVTVVVELKARFDEANNIQWARSLEEAGVHVVYGIVGYKIHTKICLVLRAEGYSLRRYVHLSTGNYNPTTARIYTDIGLLTCDPDFGEDATNLFNLLTGICQFQRMRKLIVAPFEMHSRIIEFIKRETRNAREGIPSRIIAKMNSLLERRVIEALYEASQAGVKIDLIVRGICSLRPQIKSISKNITVRSIVDRFLEHSRIYYFENACSPELYLGSADWMPRNFFRRIEIAWPVDDGIVKDYIVRQMLDITLADNARARLLMPNGTYTKVKRNAGDPVRRSQKEFIDLSVKRNNPSIQEREVEGDELRLEIIKTPPRRERRRP
ncbi:MAG: polyphosphate kinase 1 [Verrucomicrobia bacterium]|nr:polyphosphate kinase 1 [Verrucomicrobiota bacterium]